MSRSEIISLARTSYLPSGNCSRLVALSDEIGAAIPSRSVLWAINLSSLISGERAYLERLRLQYTCITAFAAPIAAGRVLGFVWLDEMPTGGSSRAWLTDKNNGAGTAGSAAVRVADTAPLTFGGAALFDAIAVASLSGLGNAGDTKDFCWDFGLSAANLTARGASLILGLINDDAFGAGGTFEIVVEADLEGLPIGYPEP